MTYPRQYERLDGEPIATGRRLFRSVLLLFGVLPIDLHAIALASLTPGHGFLESSSSLLNRRWIHERRLEPDSGGTRLTDRVYFECRVPSLGAALTPAVRAIFRHRHAQLGRRFGTGASGRSASPAVRRPLPGRSEG